MLPLAFCEFRNGLTDDDVPEVVGLLMIGESRFAREHFVEKEFARSFDVLVDLEFLHARLALRLREKVLQKGCDRAFLAGVDLLECGDDQVQLCIVGGCHDALL